MLCTGIPELQTLQDIEYLRDAFMLRVSNPLFFFLTISWLYFNSSSNIQQGTDDDAANHFHEQIIKSLNTKTTLANDVIHIVAHS